MPFVNEARIELRRFELEAAVREYNDLWDAWKVLESKAQPLSATAGAFLAGVFAYATQGAKGGMWGRGLLLLLAALLVACVVQALRSIWVITVESPHLGMAAADEVDLIIDKTRSPDSYDYRLEGLIADTARQWLTACEDVRVKLQRKTQLLRSSLMLLAWSAGITILLIVVTLFCSATA